MVYLFVKHTCRQIAFSFFGMALFVLYIHSVECFLEKGYIGLYVSSIQCHMSRDKKTTDESLLYIHP